MESHPSNVPKYRHELAVSYQHLAWCYSTAGKQEQAEQCYDKALALCNGLVGQYPRVGQYLRTLGFVQQGRGVLYAKWQRLKDAEEAHREATRVREELTQLSPGEPEALHNLAWSYYNLSNFYAETDRPELAESFREKVLATRERLVHENPRVPDYTISLAASYYAKANRLRDGGQALESLEWYGRGIQLLEDVLEKEQRDAETRHSLFLQYWGRAAALSKKLARHREALPDWDRARALDDGQYWDALWIHQAITYARLGDHGRAAGDMKALNAKAADEHKTVKDGNFYVMAYVYALSATAAADDSKLAAHDRTRLNSEYATWAVQLFRQLHAKNYFKDLKDVEHLRSASELEVLRPRDDFQELLRDMEQKLKRGKG
jgi:tetratricopeptide (TPR) repeat protein